MAGDGRVRGGGLAGGFDQRCESMVHRASESPAAINCLNHIFQLSMSDRYFDEEEVAAIFKKASEHDQQGLYPVTPGRGMTLEMLQEIGREAGMSPESIAFAARSLEVPTATTSQTFLGLPIGVGQAVEIGRRLSDADWERLVGDLRVTFNAQGVIKSGGGLREWRNGHLRAVVEPTPGGHRLRIQTLKSNSRSVMALGAASIGAAVATTAAFAIAGPIGSPGATMVISLMTMMGAGFFALGALQVPSWARRRRSQIAEVAARAAALDTPPAPEALKPGT